MKRIVFFLMVWAFRFFHRENVLGVYKRSESVGNYKFVR